MHISEDQKLTSNQYWRVEIEHYGGKYNDLESYRIVDGFNNVVSKTYCGRKDLDVICHAHNKCFLED